MDTKNRLKLFKEYKVKKAAYGASVDIDATDIALHMIGAVNNPNNSTLTTIDPSLVKDITFSKMEGAPVMLTTTSAAAAPELMPGAWVSKYVIKEGPVETAPSNSTDSGSNTEYKRGASPFNKNTTWLQFRDYMYLKLIDKKIDPETAKAMVALMGLETGHGRSTVGDYNYGNIITGSHWSGKTAKAKDNPRVFRSYESIDSAIDDYLNLNKNQYDIDGTASSKDEVYSKWLGHNHSNSAWNGKDNTKYRDSIDAVYRMYWG